MTNIAELCVGRRVHYQPSHYAEDDFENGIVKEIPTHTNSMVRVIYHCDGNWDRYKDYTSELTAIKDLKLGWKHKKKGVDE